MPHILSRATFRARTLQLRAQFDAALTTLYERTAVTVREIALTAGVSVYEVFREKLLLRRVAAA